ncbi:TetR/AcrR family transcriptional regulator [Curtobacterium flaccumfaciens]|nr:TetR/AcrR family transcriptional regulator [Curtobacterium flaccumfaciens]UXN21916.1 TetR/AcrR family transcriptional regulator [Curtobacterium flaccumfaciens pv. flaccumfaciens]
MPVEEPLPAEKPMRADARRNRDAIVAAARTAFERDEQLRFDDFAGRAGVGVGTLYRHFPTREALAAAVYRGEVDVLCRRARDSTRPAAESLDDFLHGFVEYVVDHAGLARTLAAVVTPPRRPRAGETWSGRSPSCWRARPPTGPFGPTSPPGRCSCCCTASGPGSIAPGGRRKPVLPPT